MPSKLISLTRTLVYLGCLLALLLAVCLIGLRLTGGRLLTVQTASMSPSFRPGDAVVVRPIQPAKLRAGDIISYVSPHDDTLIISHRITAIDKKTGWLTTAGDNGQAPDTAFPPRLVLGKVVAVAPHLGWAMDVVRHPVGIMLLVYLPALAVVLQEVKRLNSFYGGRRYKLIRS